MRQYHQLVEDVLLGGNHKSNRTETDTISSFSQHYRIYLQNGFPLLTTKKMDGFRWNSMIHEFPWYLSGDAHIPSLREKTSIWDEWADEDGQVDTAYGRFWRRYPIPDEGLEGASPDQTHRWVNEDERTFDQIQYVVDTLRENPQSRRIILNSWHPANASVSELPPCPYTFVFNVQDGRLNLHLTQRSGDIALGVPFNIASHSLLTFVMAQETGLKVGEFTHTIVDAHIYCGKAARGEWYEDHPAEVQSRVTDADEPEDYRAIKSWIEETAPSGSQRETDHVPGLLLQLSREPRPDRR